MEHVVLWQNIALFSMIFKLCWSQKFEDIYCISLQPTSCMQLLHRRLPVHLWSSLQACSTTFHIINVALDRDIALSKMLLCAFNLESQSGLLLSVWTCWALVAFNHMPTTHVNGFIIVIVHRNLSYQCTAIARRVIILINVVISSVIHCHNWLSWLSALIWCNHHHDRLSQLFMQSVSWSCDHCCYQSSWLFVHWSFLYLDSTICCLNQFWHSHSNKLLDFSRAACNLLKKQDNERIRWRSKMMGRFYNGLWRMVWFRGIVVNRGEWMERWTVETYVFS